MASDSSLHIAGNLRQIDYHRRLVTPNLVSTDNLSLRELASER